MKKILMNKKGSLTAEATITMAVFLTTVVTLIALLAGLYTSSLLEECLLDASMNMRSEMAFINQGTGVDLIDQTVFEKLLKRQVTQAIKERQDQRLFYDTDKLIETIDVSNSVLEYESDRMLLAVSVQWPLSYMNSQPIEIERKLAIRKWTPFVDIGAVLKADGITEVYLATHYSVYHTNPQCRSIKNRVKTKVNINDIDPKLKECQYCVEERN